MAKSERITKEPKPIIIRTMSQLVHRGRGKLKAYPVCRWCSQRIPHRLCVVVDTQRLKLTCKRRGCSKLATHAIVPQ